MNFLQSMGDFGRGLQDRQTGLRTLPAPFLGGDERRKTGPRTAGNDEGGLGPFQERDTRVKTGGQAVREFQQRVEVTGKTQSRDRIGVAEGESEGVVPSAATERTR